jgi:putative ABC transport system substrate-binding protein
VVAAELLALDPEVIVTLGPAAAAVRAAVPPTIPLVFVGQRDPVALGLVESLAHPGGNATGTATIVPEGFIGKQLQLLKDLVPRATRIAMLRNPKDPMSQGMQPELFEIGRQLGVTLAIVEASGLDQAAGAFDAADKQGAVAILVGGDRTSSIIPPKLWRSQGATGCRRSTSFGKTRWTVD